MEMKNEQKVSELLNQALNEILSNDHNCLILGEDILDPYGGAFKVTNNLSTVKSLGIDLTKLNDLSKLSQDEISKLSASNINITKLKSDLSLISSNTNLNITDFLKSKN